MPSAFSKIRSRHARKSAVGKNRSATSLAAESLRMADRIGTVVPGFEADLVATNGNPLDDITSVRRVVFVMQSGKVMKNLSK